eukprot:CAMPEP_0195507808 /NCGR_PEP_ID=MMETSP0794_2-20130614/1181_1 /TAXON_ID=515487 /ORGANISM="Stephanopyxis turris, Strain CCMP 815" /LENGTH=285 /DNA_ID=CAMNT_0040634607 /DNA_START=122 /DNA_END=979 /DNA_ORIENTATION=-
MAISGILVMIHPVQSFTVANDRKGIFGTASKMRRTSPHSSLSPLYSSAITIDEVDGEENSIKKAAKFMLESFWLPQLADNSSDVSPTTYNKFSSDVFEDLMASYGERMGKRAFNSRLISASEEGGGGILGVVGIDVALLDRENKIVFSRAKSEQMMTKAVSSLGPKQRREYKNTPVQDMASELLGSEMSAIVLLSNLSVSPNARRMGLGKKLCLEAERVVKEEWGFDEIYLRVEADNSGARGLYENTLNYKLDWVEEGAVAVRPNAENGEFEEITADTHTLVKAL